MNNTITMGPSCADCPHAFGDHAQVATKDGGRKIKCTAMVFNMGFEQTCQCTGWHEEAGNRDE